MFRVCECVVLGSGQDRKGWCARLMPLMTNNIRFADGGYVSCRASDHSGDGGGGGGVGGWGDSAQNKEIEVCARFYSNVLYMQCIESRS
jgi:hypothetical protein